jgi:hypothetical protein
VRVGPFRVGDAHPVRVITRWEGVSGKAVLEFLEEQLKTAGSIEPEILEFPLRGRQDLESLRRVRADLAGETSRLAFFGRLECGLSLAKDALADLHLAHWAGLAGAGLAERRDFLAAAKAGETSLYVEAGDVNDLLALERECREAGVGVLLALAAPGPSAESLLHGYRLLAAKLAEAGSEAPLHLKAPAQPSEEEQVLESSILLGALLCDGLGDSLQVDSKLDPKRNLRLVYNILQAAGVRITKTEYVSCPSCGRTLFDLQSTTERIQSKTGHLKGVKIAIMGCIVNGPGEMADADFGYVGGAPDRINLYVGKECVQKGIPSDHADQALIDLIKTHGKWVDPPSGA